MFIPGKIVNTFTTKKGEEAVIRYPKWEDLEQMTEFINTLSKEDTFITFSGETIYKDGEMYYLSEMCKSMEMGNSMYLGCFINGVLVGSSTVLRDTSSRKRSYHVGIFGITIAAVHRKEGIGEELANITLQQAQQTIPGLKMFILNVYSPNEIAMHMYKKLGFMEAGRIPKSIWYRGAYVDEVKMYKHLPDFL